MLELVCTNKWTVSSRGLDGQGIHKRWSSSWRTWNIEIWQIEGQNLDYRRTLSSQKISKPGSFKIKLVCYCDGISFKYICIFWQYIH